MAHELYRIEQEKNLEVTKLQNLKVTKLRLLAIKVFFYYKDLSLNNHGSKIRASVRLQPYHNIERFLKGKIKEIHTIIKAAYLLTHKIVASGFRCFSFTMKMIHQWKKLGKLRLYQRIFYILYAILHSIGFIWQIQTINSSITALHIFISTLQVAK